MNSNSPTRVRALQLLSTGIAATQVAAACGVTDSAISQLQTDPDFAAELALLRYKNLAAQNERDSSYDEMEDALLSKLKSLLPLMMRPMEVLKAIQVINAAKRRGQSAPESITAQQTIVNIQLPTILATKFIINPQGQVTQAGSQSLETIQSGFLLKGIKNDELQKRVEPNSTSTEVSVAER